MKFSKIVAAISVVVGGGVAYAQNADVDPNVQSDVNPDVNQDPQVDRDMGQQDTQAQRQSQLGQEDQATQDTQGQKLTTEKHVKKTTTVGAGGEKSIKKTATVGSATENKRACKSAEVFFKFDSAALSSNDDQVLKPLVDELNKYEGTTIVLDGFADPRGSENYNVILSGRRSDAVRDKLISMGAPKERIVLGLHGEKGTRSESYPDDRRVTAWITRNTTKQIVDHELESGAQALAFGDQMKTIAELGGQRERNRPVQAQAEVQTTPEG